MCRSLVSIQKASFGKIGNTGAGCGDKRATRVPFAQPRHKKRTFRDSVELVPARRGNKNDVGMLDLGDCTIRSKCKRTGRTDFASIDRHGSHAKSRRLGFAMQPVPDHAGGMEDFNWGDGRGHVATLKKNDRHVEQTIRGLRYRRVSPGCRFFRHESHIHLDLIERTQGYRMCQWDVREPAKTEVAAQVPLPPPRPAVPVAR